MRHTHYRKLHTDRKREDKLQVLGEMSTMLAHEIRNPLGSIKGFASLLEKDLIQEPEKHNLILQIIEGVDHLNHLVTHVLNYSRPLEANLVDTDLLQLIHDLARQLEADERLQSKIHLEIHSLLESLVLPLDPLLFKSAVLNVLLNALQAIAESGVVSMTLTQESGYAVLIVVDNGVGISSQNLPKLFSPFFTTKSSGYGFGLTEVDRVMEAHRGEIEVRSTINEGTTFTLRLPLKR